MSATNQARQAQQSDWIDWVARAGLVAYGVVYVLIGWLAIQLAFGDRSGRPSSSGALRELAQQPFGGVLIWVVSIGMFLLALWQGLEAAVGHRDEDGKKRVAKRVASAGKAIVYVVIGISGVKVAVGSGGSSGKGGEETFTAQLMDLPGGQVLVGAVGLAIIGFGGYQLYRAWTEASPTSSTPRARVARAAPPTSPSARRATPRAGSRS